MGFLESTALYNMLRGPLVWLAFIIFIVGSFYKVYSLVKQAKGEKVVLPFINFRSFIRSVIHWLIPFGSRSWRLRPVFTIITFSFHISLVFTPIFLLAHNLLWYESWGISWWTFSESLADIFTIIVIIGCVFLILRRIFSPVVNFVTFKSDIAFILICFFTFLSGFLAYHQWLLPYKAMLNVHILFGEVMLISIPFTRLAHMFYFFLTRAWMGSQFALWGTKDW
jgi:nitrate reductase gamma subunit|uniref:Nitrate reductase n=1 Tax=Thermodesulfobium narugense TaxID=184064 RepID=A0A7C5P8T6_9BACT